LFVFFFLLVARGFVHARISATAVRQKLEREREGEREGEGGRKEREEDVWFE